MKTRLFIGNLAETVTEEELRSKFEALLSSHQNEAEVGGVEVRCKNEDNYFGYVDIHLKDGAGPDGSDSNNKMPPFLRKYVDLMNNTKWKGSLIKVQQAKESFIDKLRKEQGSHPQQNSRFQHGDNFRNQRKEKDDGTEQSRHNRQANDVLRKLNKSKERYSSKGKGKFRTYDEGADPGFEIVTSSSTATSNKNEEENVVSPSKQSPSKHSPSPPPKTSKTKKSPKKAYKSSSSDTSSDEDDEIRDGIPKFRGLLLSYPDGPPQESITSPKKPEKKTKEDPPLKQIPSPNKPATSSGGVNFKRSRQEKSDQLRMQSFEKLKELKSQRSNIIKTSLSTISADPLPIPENRVKLVEIGDEEDEEEEDDPKSKKSKMDLFNDEDEESDDDDDAEANLDENAFIRKQFEGKQGQKLLELQASWGNDSRFKIDKRFETEYEKDGGEDDEEDVEKEKDKQLDILTGILGKPLDAFKRDKSAKKKSSSASGEGSTTPSSSVIVTRYDPEAEEEKEEQQQQKSENKKSKKQEKAKEAAEDTPKPIRSTEPSTFKTVSNLKELFSSSGKDTESDLKKKKLEITQTQSSTFSLLAAYGGGDAVGNGYDSSDDENEQNTSSITTITKKTTSSSASTGPRNFWQSNPFKYDSSEDEDEDGNKNKKKSEVKVTIDTSKTSAPQREPSILSKTPFFFTKYDSRFAGLEDFFLKDEIKPEGNGYNNSKLQNGVANNNEGDSSKKEEIVEDFSVKRQELKAIVKAKIRNTKRKDEKRTLAIKRALRKRKMKNHQKNKFNFNNR